MKTINLVVKILFTLFFIPAIGVHIYGLVTPLPGSTESIPSHFIHIISYSVCFYAILKAINYRLLIYSIAAVYPFLYHAYCFFSHLQQQKFTAVCLLVIVMLSLGAAWIKWRR